MRRGLVIMFFFATLIGCRDLEKESSFGKQLQRCSVLFKVNCYLLAPEGISFDDILIESERDEFTWERCPDGSVRGKGGLSKSVISMSENSSYSYDVGCSVESVFPDRIKFYCYGELNGKSFRQFSCLKWGDIVTVFKCTTKRPLLVLVVVIQPVLIK